MSNIVQYMVINAAIHRKLNWPLGAVIAQCCHATTAVSHIYRGDSETIAYLKNIDNMHKIVLEVQTEEELKALSDQLNSLDIKHKLWIEMPEDMATCIAIKPYEKKSVEKYFRKLRLFQ